MLQPEVRQRVESEYRTLFESRMYGTTVFSPLCFGFLTGKYNDGKLPENSRGYSWLNDDELDEDYKGEVMKFFGPDTVEKTKKTLQGLGEVAKKFGCTQAQLALAWVIASQDISTAIIGVSRIEQVEENLKAIEVAERWTPEVEKEISDLLANAPELDQNFRTWTSKPSRRPAQA